MRSLFTLLLCLTLCCPLLGAQAEDVSSAALSLTVNRETAEISIRAGDDTLWSSYPVLPDKLRDSAGEDRRNAILSVTLADRYNNRNTVSSWSGSVQAGGLTVEDIPGGARLTFDFPAAAQDFSIPLDVTLTGNALRAEIRFDLIENRGDMTIAAVALMPYFGAALETDEGYLLIPDGAGALIEYGKANPEAAAYAAQMYAPDPALDSVREKSAYQPARLPVLGIRKNGRALLMIAEQGAGMATVSASAPGKSSRFSTAYMSFSYTVRDTYVIADKDLFAQTVTVSAPRSADINPVVSYRFLADDAGWVDMANALRDYLQNEAGFTRRAEANIGLYARVFGGATEKRSFLGIGYEAISAVTTFRQAGDIASALAEGGGTVSLLLMGFQPGGMFKNARTLTFDSRLGGMAGYEELAKVCEQQGVSLFPMLDLCNDYAGDTGGAARTVAGDHATRGFADLMTGVLQKNAKWTLRAPTLLALPRDTGNLYLYEMGAMLYGDRNEARYASRDKALSIFADILREAASRGALIADGGSLYAARFADALVQTPVTDSHLDVATASVPFYQTALHGLTALAGAALNECADPEAAFLEQMATADSISVTLTHDTPFALRDTALKGLISTEFALWRADIAAWQTRARALDGLGDRFIQAYETLAPGVTLTTFEGGDRVLVNRANESYSFEGQAVPARDFIRLRAE